MKPKWQTQIDELDAHSDLFLEFFQYTSQKYWDAVKPTVYKEMQIAILLNVVYNAGDAKLVTLIFSVMQAYFKSKEIGQSQIGGMAGHPTDHTKNPMYFLVTEDANQHEIFKGLYKEWLKQTGLDKLDVN